jgi:hypothetical protein
MNTVWHRHAAERRGPARRRRPSAVVWRRAGCAVRAEGIRIPRSALRCQKLHMHKSHASCLLPARHSVLSRSLQHRSCSVDHVAVSERIRSWMQLLGEVDV